MTKNPIGNMLKLEKSLARTAKLQLELNPVRQTFDVAHLKELHRRHTQPLHDKGFYGYQPGKFRADDNHFKDKGRGGHTVVYSPMNNDARKGIEETIKRYNPKEIAKLNTKDASYALGNLYAELDQKHPFNDANSRTFRDYVSDVARKSGYSIDWRVTEKNPHSYYAARDQNVNAISAREIKDSRVPEKINGYMKENAIAEFHIQTGMVRPIEGFNRAHVLSPVEIQSRTETFNKAAKGEITEKDALRQHPGLSNALTFDKLAKGRVEMQDALKTNPELKDSVKLLGVAAEHFKSVGLNDAQQRNAMKLTRDYVQDKLIRGDSNFQKEIAASHTKTPTPQQTMTHSIAPIKQPERAPERERSRGIER